LGLGPFCSSRVCAEGGALCAASGAAGCPISGLGPFCSSGVCAEGGGPCAASGAVQCPIVGLGPFCSSRVCAEGGGPCAASGAVQCPIMGLGPLCDFRVCAESGGPCAASGAAECPIVGLGPLSPAKLGARADRKAKTWDSPQCPGAKNAWGSVGSPGFRREAFARRVLQVALGPLGDFRFSRGSVSGRHLGAEIRIGFERTFGMAWNEGNARASVGRGMKVRKQLRARQMHVGE
jgi:hypothetical protein